MRTIKEHRSNTSQACICATTRDGGPPPGSTRLDAGFSNKNNTVHGNPGKGLPSTARIHIIGYMIQFLNSHNRETSKSRTKASKPDHGLFPALLPMKQVFLFLMLLFSGIAVAQNPIARIQSTAGRTGNAATSFTATLTASPVNGNALIAVISTRGSASNQVTSISQTGATWTRATQNVGIGVTTEIWYALNVSGAGTVITFNQQNVRSAAAVAEYSNILAAGALDKVAGASGNSTTASTGTTATTTTANQLFIGVGGLSASNYFWTGYTNSFLAFQSTQATGSPTSSNTKVVGVEKFVTTTQTATTSGAVNVSSQWSSCIATFKAINTFGAASSTPTLCINTALTSFTHTTSGATGIANAGTAGANGLPAGVAASWNSNTITIFGTPSAAGTFNYSIPLTGGAGSVNATGTITVTAANTPGTASSTPTLCTNTALTNITRTTTGATGIGTASGLPAGVSAAWASNVITISGTPTAAGTFSYSIPLTDGCGSVNATGTITVTDGIVGWANLQSPGSETVCVTKNAIVYGQIYKAGYTEAAGANAAIVAEIGYSSTNTNPSTWAAGNWAAASFNVQSGNNDEYYANLGASLASGTYYYAFRYKLNGCNWYYGGYNAGGGGFWNGTGNNNGVLTVSPNNTVGGASSTPTLCINTALTNITHTTTGATGISNAGVQGANGLPAGVAASWNSNTITIFGTPSASGTFNYSIPLAGGCGSVNATGTITVTANNTITLTSAAGTNAQLNCINAAITNITYSTSGATGATFSGLPAGVSGNWAANVVTISGTPTAYGVSNYTVTLTGGCGAGTANGSLNVNGLDYGNLQFPGTQTICPGNNFTAYGQVFEPGITEAAGANVNIEAQFGYNTSNNDPSTWPAGNWSATSYSTQSGNNDEYRIDFGSALASGTYYYTFRYRINGCSWQYGGAFSGFWNGTSNVNGVLTVSPINTPGTASSNPTLCINTPLTNITRTTTGATGIGASTGLPAGVSAAWSANVLTISGTPTASGTFNYSIPLTGGCGSVNATGTITVSPASVGGSVAGSATVCTGTNSTTLTLSGNTGSVTRWESSLDNFATAGTSIANTTTSLTATNLSATTYYRAVITNSVCAAANSATATVTVSPASVGGTIAGSATVCTGTNSTPLTLSGHTGAITRWESSTSSTFASAVTSIANTTTSLTASNLSVTTYYRAVITSGVCAAANSATATVTVSPASVGGSVAGSATVCTGTNSTTLTLSGNTGSVTRWESSLDNFATAGTSIANTTTSLTATNLSATTYYRAVITNSVCAAANSATATVTVNPKPVIANKTAAICSGQAFSVTPVTGTDIVPAGTTYTWTVVVNANVTGETNQAVSQSSISQTLTNTTNTVQNVVYTVTPTSPSGSCVGSTFTVTVSVNPTPVIANKTATICSGGTFSISPTNGGAEIVPAGSVYSWTVVANVNLTGEASGSDLSTISGTLNNLSNSNQTIVYTVVPTAGLCDGASFTVTVTVTPTSVGGTIAGSATVCTGTNSTTLTLSGNTGSVTRWESSLDNFATAGTSIANTTTSLTATNLTATTYYRAVITSGVCASTNSATATVTVSPASVGGTIAGSATVCTGTNSTTLTLSAYTGSITRWESSTSSTFASAVTSIANTTTSLTATNLTATTYYRAVITNSVCAAAYSATATVTVSALSVGGTITGSASKCANNASTLLTLVGYTGSVVKWQSSTSSTFASAVTEIVNTAATYTTPASLSVTTYYRAVVQNGVCGTANSATATITITQPGSGNFSYAAAGYCTSSATVAVNASNFTGVTGAFSSTAGLSINSSTGLLTPSSSTAGNYVVTYTIPASGGCALYSTTTNVTIDRAGSGTIVYSTPSVCTGLAGTISPTITGANGSGVSVWYTSTAGLNLNATNGQITPSTSGAGVYTVDYHRSASAYCPAYVNSTTVTINSTPGITSSTPAARCGTGSVQLGATSASGTVYWYDVTSGGTSLGSGVNFNTPTISANTTYYAEAVASNGCVTTTRTAVLATVNAIPTITATTPNSRCGTGTVVLGATASAGTLNWYDAATGGTLLGTGTSFTTPSISVTDDYFVGAVSSAGCTSAARTMVTATVKTIPSITSTTPGANCGTGTVALSALASAGTISWFAASTGGTALATGTNYTTPSISSTTNYYVEVTDNGCTSGRTMVAATISTTPSVSSSIAGNRCGAGSVTMFATPSAGATLKWYTASTGGSLLATGNSYTVNLSSSTTYYVQASVGTCLQPSRTAITANINAIPTISVTANYCSVPGFAVLTATAGMNSYLWNTGQTTQAINVDQAGVYNVIGTTAAGCADTATFGVATELVTNGSFDAGNTGFTTNYTYVADIAGPQSEMYPEGTYAVVPNPNSVHNAFYGADRHGDGGNIMVINGSPAMGTNVWNQNSTTVLPNTTYYFSAWAMSVVNGNNAILQFSINGNQVGTIAYLGNGYTNSAGPYTWVRFYGQWNSGSTTTANLSIVNLNLIAGGNDFAMDDISFGTMSPVALSSVPLVNSGTSACQGDPLVLNSEAIGGASPFSYAWTGPNGFTSTLENPQVTATASTTQNGTYNLTVTDGFGCTANSSVVVSVSALPASQTLSAAVSSVCSGGSTDINLASSETGVYYQLRNNANNSSVGALVQGTGSALSLPTGVLNATTTFNVLATRFPANCDVQMTGTVIVSLSTTPVLVITNQAACSGTVNLTAAGVTAGSTGSGTLTYWTTLAATTAVATPTAVTSGTYYIQSTNGSCSDIQAVLVSISTNPTVTFTYSSATFCTTAVDPLPTLDGAAGVFSASPAGLVFMNNNTGEIDLSASAPGTYTVTNTVTPSGACAPKSASRTLTISAAPLAAFNYISNDLCQSANALNAAPIFEAGAAAGTFSTSSGLSLNTSTGVINVSASTPGNYAVVNTRAATSGCPSFADTTFLDINPYIFTGAVSASTSDEIICLNETVDLYSSATSYATVLLREKFNGSINNWVKTNNSTGGTPASAAWTLRQSIYNYSGNNHSSNDNSQFYMSNSDAQGGGTTSTILRSPVMSTVGFSTLSLDFFQFFDARSSGDDAKVQISTNNTTWTDLVTYTTDQGSRTGFTNAVFNLNAYIGLPTVYIRFVYTASNDRQWAIDNVSVTGNSINYGYAWSSSPAGYTSNLQNPTALAPVTNSNYIVTATNGFGCSNPASPVPVTVNPLPADNAGIDQNICGSGSVSIGDVVTSGNTYVWSPATGLSDATASNPTATPGITRTYTLTETISATGCSDTNKVVLTVTPLPTITSSTDAGRCGTGTVTVSAVSSTGTMSWFSAAVGGASLGSGSSFTTPSISASTTYYAEATSATCLAASRTAVIASVNALPVISSQSTAAANYSQGQVASSMSVTATAGSGTISTYVWFYNASASNTGGSPIASSNSDSHVPSTAVSGTLYYYCVVSNSNGCATTSAVSGAITTIVTPSFSVVTASPMVAGQGAATGFKGQTININGANFAANAQVTFNGVSAASVTVMNASQIIAVVNNTGASTTGNLTVTNPSTGAFASTAFSFIGYTSNGNSFDWSSNASWLGNTKPAAGADVFIRHTGFIGTTETVSLNRMQIMPGTTLTLSTSNPVSVVDVVNDGTIQWAGTTTLNIGGTLTMSASGSVIPGDGTIAYTKAGDQLLFSGSMSSISFNNLQLMGSGTKTMPSGADIMVNNLSIGSGVTFNPGTVTSEIMISGNVSVDGSLNSTASDIHFIGTADQSLSLAGTGTISLSALRVNKASGTLLLNDNVRVMDSLTMISGNINTQGNMFEIGSSISSKGVLAHTAGYIQGIVRRWYSGTNAGATTGMFPVGELKAGNVWENRNVQLNYTSAPSTGGHLTVEFMTVSMNANVTGTQTTIDSSATGGTHFNIGSFAEEGYWKIDNQLGTLIDGAYTISITGENFTSIGTDLEMLSMVKRVSLGDWFAPGTHLVPTGDITMATLTRTGVSGFSNFGFGIAQPDIPLPVNVSSMSVDCGGLNPSFNWTTVQERDAKEFIVQQSADGKSWKELGTVNAAGNSDRVLHYSFDLRDMNSHSAYVRLVLRNNDASLQAFNALAVSCKQGLKKEEMSLFPNPSKGVFSIDLKSINEGVMSVRVLNTLGVEVAGQLHNAARNSKINMDIQGLPAGIYQVLVGPEGEAPLKSFKVVIN